MVTIASSLSGGSIERGMASGKNADLEQRTSEILGEFKESLAKLKLKVANLADLPDTEDTVGLSFKELTMKVVRILEMDEASTKDIYPAPPKTRWDDGLGKLVTPPPTPKQAEGMNVMAEIRDKKRTLSAIINNFYREIATEPAKKISDYLLQNNLQNDMAALSTVMKRISEVRDASLVALSVLALVKPFLKDDMEIRLELHRMLLMGGEENLQKAARILTR